MTPGSVMKPAVGSPAAVSYTFFFFPLKHMPRAGGRGNGELVFPRRGVSVWKDEKVLEMEGGNGCTTV